MFPVYTVISFQEHLIHNTSYQEWLLRVGKQPILHNTGYAIKNKQYISW